MSMNNAIRVVNLLHDAKTQVAEAGGTSSSFGRLDLPQIVVVGSQSSGKSSVLESFVGKDFLPRGQGIVTRRPLVLQLLQHNGVEYGEFSHKPGQKLYSFHEIMKEIQTETDRTTGSRKGISPVPINLRLYSPNVLDLTLVDLPGMTKVPVGDQPPDIEQQIRAMIKAYIESEKCIILAVCPANADIANSDALQIAREVDPTFDRTIGVLTKLDLMDDGTDASEVLENKVYPLKYGYIGVVNRSQRDLDERLGVHDAIEAEQRFFKSNVSYFSMADRMGCAYLQKTLNEHLLRNISEYLPELRSELEATIHKSQLELEKLHFSDRVIPNWQYTAIIVELTGFADRFMSEIFGNNTDDVDISAHTIGADIRCLFHVWYPFQIAALKSDDAAELKRLIYYNLQNSKGIRNGLFIPDDAFFKTVIKQVSKMGEPTEQLLSRCRAKTEESVMKCLKPMQGFPNLYGEVRSRVNAELSQIVFDAEDAVKMFLDWEKSYVNIKHDDFVGFNIDESPDAYRSKRKNPHREIVHEGPLAIGAKKLVDRAYNWFVLTCESLTWFKNKSKKEIQYSISLTDQSLFTKTTSKSRVFVLLAANPKQNIYKSSNKLELTAFTQEEMEEWILKLMDVGVPLQGTDLDEDDDIDPHTRNQIETVYVIVESYLRIVRQNLQDKIPKCIVHSLFNKLKLYFKTRLIGEVARQDAKYLMQEDETVAEKRLALKEHHDKCVKALESIGSANITPVRVAPNFIKPPNEQKLPKPIITKESPKNKLDRANGSTAKGVKLEIDSNAKFPKVRSQPEPKPPSGEASFYFPA